MKKISKRCIRRKHTSLYGKTKGHSKPCGIEWLLVRPEGFEPPAFWSVARRSIQLS